jgi:6-phosphogluconolactonase
VTARLAALPRPFDVMLLGMGADGHTASLFPGSPALQASLHGDGAGVQAVDAPGARGSAERITLALPTILDSRFIALLITGEDKLETLARAQAGSDPLELPIRAILQQAATPVHIYWSA